MTAGILERCIADGCQRAAEKDRKYCHGHRKREKYGRPLDVPLREWGADPAEYLATKALELAEAKDADENAYRLALKRLKHAAVQFVRKATRPKVPKRTKTPA